MASPGAHPGEAICQGGSMGMLRRHGPLIILLLLGLQGAIFLRSLDGGTGSILCTGGHGLLPGVYTVLHLGFVVMAVLGLAALQWPHLRLPYAALLIAGLALLLFQPMLVASGHLTCGRL
jgi:hypothetical protein